MKNLMFSKLGCGVMIGLLMPLSVAQASDVNDLIQSRLGDGTVTQMGQQDAWSMPKGAQGPIRSDSMPPSASRAPDVNDLIQSRLGESTYAANTQAMKKLVSE